MVFGRRATPYQYNTFALRKRYFDAIREIQTIWSKNPWSSLAEISNNCNKRQIVLFFFLYLFLFFVIIIVYICFCLYDQTKDSWSLNIQIWNDRVYYNSNVGIYWINCYPIFLVPSNRQVFVLGKLRSLLCFPVGKMSLSVNSLKNWKIARIVWPTYITPLGYYVKLCPAETLQV